MGIGITVATTLTRDQLVHLAGPDAPAKTTAHTAEYGIEDGGYRLDVPNLSNTVYDAITAKYSECFQTYAYASHTSSDQYTVPFSMRVANRSDRSENVLADKRDILTAQIRTALGDDTITLTDTWN